MRRAKSLRIGVHHANAVVWGPVYRTHLTVRLRHLTPTSIVRGIIRVRARAVVARDVAPRDLPRLPQGRVQPPGVQVLAQRRALRAREREPRVVVARRRARRRGPSVRERIRRERIRRPASSSSRPRRPRPSPSPRRSRPRSRPSRPRRSRPHSAPLARRARAVVRRERVRPAVPEHRAARRGELGPGAFSFTPVPIRSRLRGERRSLRTFPGDSLRPGSLAFNPRPRCLSTPLLTPFNSTPPSLRMEWPSAPHAGRLGMRAVRHAQLQAARRLLQVPRVADRAQARRDVVEHTGVHGATREAGGARGAARGTTRGRRRRRRERRRRAAIEKPRRRRSSAFRCVLYTGPHTTAFAW
jgi:hypothetical protein